jgi:hypothetical protein
MGRYRNWILLFTLALLILLLGAAPTRTVNGGCLFCGRSRSQAWFFGIKVKDRIEVTQGSAWVDKIVPDHTSHIWAASSTELKPWGFGRRSIGCGGVGAGAIAQIDYLKRQLGEDRARDLLKRYHSQLHSDPVQIHLWLREEFATALPAAVNATKAP